MSLKDDIARLAPRQTADKRLANKGNPQALREKTGLERTQTGKVQTEQVTAQSTDGLFTFVVNVIKG